MGFAGPGLGQTLMDYINESYTPTPYGGNPTAPGGMDLPTANYGQNLLRNGSVESWTSGASAAPDGFTLTGTSASVARNIANTYDSLASVALTNGASNAADLAQSRPIAATENARLRGRTVTFSVALRLDTANRVFLKIDDAVGTSESAPIVDNDSVFRVYSLTRVLDVAATKVECSVELTSGAAITVYADAWMLVEGDAPVGFSLSPVDLLLVPRSVEGTDQSKATTTEEDLSGMSIANVALNGKQSVHVIFSGQIGHSTVGERVTFLLRRDATQVPAAKVLAGDTAAITDPGDGTKAQAIAGTWIDRKPAAGLYTYKLRWALSAITGYVFQPLMTLSIFPDE